MQIFLIKLRQYFFYSGYKHKVRSIMSDALEMYLSDMKICRILLKYFGLDVLREHAKINFMTYFVIIDLLLFNFSQMYSVYYFRDDFFERLFSVMTWPFGILVGLAMFILLLLCIKW